MTEPPLPPEPPAYQSNRVVQSHEVAAVLPADTPMPDSFVRFPGWPGEVVEDPNVPPGQVLIGSPLGRAVFRMNDDGSSAFVGEVRVDPAVVALTVEPPPRPPRGPAKCELCGHAGSRSQVAEHHSAGFVMCVDTAGCVRRQRLSGPLLARRQPASPPGQVAGPDDVLPERPAAQHRRRFAQGGVVPAPPGGDRVRAFVSPVVADRPLEPGPLPPTSAGLQGRHDLVIAYGDAEFVGSCSCGRPLVTLRPDQSLNLFGPPWEAHVMGIAGG